MSKITSRTEEQLKELVAAAMSAAKQKGDLPEVELPEVKIEVPADAEHGDYATNVAMAGARCFRMPPVKIAQAIADNLKLDGTYFDRFEIAGPGFINFFLGSGYYSAVLNDVLDEGADYGRSDVGAGKRVLVEFVSANPTGPMHIGNARGGALGDCLSSVLEAAGYYVEREFYVNDAGNQIEKFKTSLEVRYLQMYKDGVEMPEDAYQGADITEHAKNFAKIYGDKYVDCDSETRRGALCDYALPLNIAGLQRDLGRYRIKYDTWFRESSLHQSGAVADIIERLKASGYTYEQDGALWFRSSELGDEKDRVLVRANGVPTYFVPDIAYHYNKLVTRGFDTAIDILGADHHGYIPRMKAAMKALGVDPDRLDMVIMQMVRLVRDGETIKLSKRSGKAITLVTLLDDVPIDAARFFFNTREPNSHLEFDLGLAIEQSSQNPVYYVQYAHARICSLIKRLAAEGVELRRCSDDELALLTAPEERQLIRHLAALTDVIAVSARQRDPSRVTHYVSELAAMFHKFYNACRVKTEDASLTAARLSLCSAVRSVIFNVLTMLKVDAPESM